jgi:hypothetical protein
MIDAPDAEIFAAHALELLADEPARERLARCGIVAAMRYTDLSYADATAQTILRIAGSSTRSDR